MRLMACRTRVAIPVLEMSDSHVIDWMDRDATGSDHDHGHLGLLLLSTIVFGLAGAFYVLLSGGTMLMAFLAYMAGGWLGIGLAALTVMWRTTPV